MAYHQFKRLIVALCLFTCLSCEHKEVAPGKLWADATRLHNSHKLAALTDLSELQQRVLQFLDEPDNPERLLTAKNAWRNAHTSFLQVKFLTPPQMSEVDAWPIEPGFLDVLPAYPESGIVSDLTLEITATVLRHQHQFTDPTEAALGFHVIEFLIFSRPSTDFLVSEDPKTDRRRQILELVTALLVEDLSLKLGELIVNPMSTEEQLHQLMTLLEHSASHLYGESLQLVVDPHSKFSGQSRKNLLTQIKIIEQLIFDPVNLGSKLVQLNDTLTRDITHTVREIITLLESNGSDAEISEMCSRLLNGLDHQLRSFTSQLAPEIN